MCDNCGINHETGQLENQDALMAFLMDLLGDVEEEPAEDFFAKHGLTSEYDLFGSNELVNDWKVSVAKVPADTPEDNELFGFDWVLQGYHEGNLVASNAGTPPEPVTAREAAQAFAEYHFGYVIED